MSAVSPETPVCAIPAQPLMFSSRAAWMWIGVALLVYVAGYAAFPPNAILSSDESLYIAQAVALSHGRITLPKGQPFSPVITQDYPSWYPSGTSLLETPFVFLGGWRAAACASVLATVATVLLLALWLQQEKRPPLFALMFLGYAPVLVLGRMAMSDVPSAAIVTLGLWLFWSGQQRAWPWWAASGFLAGLSQLFRDSNALLFAPLFAGAVIRDRWRALALFLGGCAGLAVRLGVEHVLHGSAFYFRHLPKGYEWTLAAGLHNASFYLFALLLMVPAGLAGGLLYRGRRRPEIVITVLLGFGLYLFYTYSAEDSGGLKRLVLAPRFYIPLTTLLIFGVAEWAPRTWNRILERKPQISHKLVKAARILVTVWATGIVIAAFAVHPVLYRWGRYQMSMAKVIKEETAEGAALISNHAGTQKLINPVFGFRIPIDRYFMPAEKVKDIFRAHPDTYIVFLNRNDSEILRSEGRDNDTFVSEVSGLCRLRLLHDAWHDPQDHLRIWKVMSCP